MKLDAFEVDMLCCELIALNAMFDDFSGDFSRFQDKANFDLLSGMAAIISNTIHHIKDELSKAGDM